MSEVSIVLHYEQYYIPTRYSRSTKWFVTLWSTFNITEVITPANVKFQTKEKHHIDIYNKLLLLLLIAVYLTESTFNVMSGQL